MVKTTGRVLYKCGVTIKMKPRLIRLTYVCLDVWTTCFISSLKTTEKRHILVVTGDNHRKAVTHENASKSSIGTIHMTSPRINAKIPLSLLWQHEQSAYAYANEGFLKNSFVLETSAIIRQGKYFREESHIVVKMKHTLNSARVMYNEDGFTL